jgi:hypothetical protein
VVWEIGVKTVCFSEYLKPCYTNTEITLMRKDALKYFGLIAPQPRKYWRNIRKLKRIKLKKYGLIYEEGCGSICVGQPLHYPLNLENKNEL